MFLLDLSDYALTCLVKSVFGSVVMVIFQIAFHSEIYQNNTFLFFKNYF